MVKIYCHGMDTCSPTEYVTLMAPPSENYGHRMLHRKPSQAVPGPCGSPSNVTIYVSGGATSYSKIRVKVGTFTLSLSYRA